MFRLDLSAPDAPRVLYTSEDYVPAFRAVSDAGLTADRWWIDTGETHEERSLHTAALRPWSAEQRAALPEARALAEQFARQHRRPPSLDREDDLAWFDEAWWKAHPDQNPLLDLEAERLHKLARCVYLAPPGSSLPDGQRGDLTPPGPPLPQGQRGRRGPRNRNRSESQRRQPACVPGVGRKKQRQAKPLKSRRNRPPSALEGEGGRGG
jgi:hypothetical protein